MLGGEFIRHGAQQKAKMTVVNPRFPGMAAAKADFDMHEEWYSLKNFAPDLHVLLVNETTGMEGKDYQRPRFPATWARRHQKGRVFYTSMGHREDVWTNPIFQSIFIGGMQWAMGQIDADIPANIDQVTPGANVLPTV
jgi:type 1 glutamine amidotransferase